MSSYVWFFWHNLYFLHMLFLFKISLSAVDISYKIRLNDYFLNSFYFYWTNITYLPLFILFISLLFFFKKGKALRINLVLIKFTTLFSLLSIIIDSNLMLVFSLSFENFLEGLNKLLINSVNKIHPPLLFFSMLIFTSSFVFSLKYSEYKLFFYSWFRVLFHRSLHVYLVLCPLAIYLGSWWAIQEGSWGGWWNWDSSEVFSILVFFKMVSIMHVVLFVKAPNSLINYTYNSFLVLLTFYLFMQLNFSLISHNFTSRPYKFFNLEFFYLILLTFTVFLVTRFNHLRALPSYYLYSSGAKTTNKEALIIKYATLTMLYLSTLPLLSNFLWDRLGLELVNYVFSFTKLTLILIVVLWSLNYINLNYHVSPLCLSPYFFIFNLYVLLWLRNAIAFVRNLHYIPKFLIIYNLYISHNLFTEWDYGLWLLYKHKLFQVSIDLGNIFFSFNFISNTNSLESRSFWLFFGDGICYQTFFLSHIPNFSLMSTVDLAPSVLSILFLMTYLLFLNILYRKLTK